MPVSRYQDRPIAAKAQADRSRTLGSFALACLLLSIAVLAVYGRTTRFGFTNFDDPEYVVENPPVRDGWSAASVRWAWTTTHQANWHPLTWMSLMLDAEIGGADAAAFHRTNVALHLAATLLLFAALDRMTRARAPSAWVAALFAVHPLHVESVAWIAERKDVLSTALWFATLLAWSLHLERRSALRYSAALGAFALGLLAKPMLVTLPFTLLLLDAWPLGRISLDREGMRSRLLPLVREKLPFFGLSVVSSIVTVYAQHAGGALGTFETYPLGSRIANALLAYVSYLRATCWPAGLAVFYPHPGRSLPIGGVLLASALLVLVSIGAYRARRARPYVAVGWLWYLGTLLPVIGVVQVGLQARADRYTYVPLVGIFILVAWGVRDLTTLAVAGASPSWPRRARVLLLAAGAASVAGFATVAYVQAGVWRDAIVLFEHTIAVTGDNAVARNNLGSAYYKRHLPGDLERSVEQYAEAVRINPSYAVAFNNLAGSLMRLDRRDEAIARWRDAIRIKPSYVAARCNLAGALFKAEDHHEAEVQAEEALRYDPRASCAHYNLGLVLLKQQRFPEAEAHLAELVRLDPADASGHLNLGVVRAKLGRLEDAAAQFEEVLRLDPGNEMARHNLARARAR